ncbi:MAG TPA: cytochrome c biogenesis protein ResB, partial [Pseudobdellovibrionaceae bacterium]|nr:cytochrome c biogenesis protein ResB [Pseudobdellovibrionaceae bacterium]
NREVVLPEAELQVWASFNGDTYTRINHSEVDFFTKRPSESQPFVLTIAPPDDLKVTNYKPYVIPKREVKESNFATAGSALRFHFENSAAKSVEWLVQRNPTINAEFAMGPLKMILGKAPEYKDSPRPTHEVVFTPLLNKDNQPSGKIRVSIFAKGKNEPLSISESEEGGVVRLPWMNAQVRLLRFLPRAEEEWQISELDRPTSVSTSAIEVHFKGNKKWILLDDVVKFFSADSVYLISYIHRRISIHFPITLKKFEMAKYQGTQRAMSYQSTVDVPTLGERVISMNEPLKHEGLTFYQASYEQDPNTGQPIASVLSVNHDPGRFLKYLGSLIMSLGIVFLFYFKSMDFKFKKGNLNGK